MTITLTPQSQPQAGRNRSPSVKWKELLIKDPEGLKSYFNSPYTLKLIEILENEELELLKSKLSDYENASWAYRQADINGRIAVINIVKDLLNKQ